MICPECHGKGKILTRHKDIILECQLCDSTGEISEEQFRWVMEGAKMKDVRIEKRLPLHKAARKLGIQGLTLSSMERGMIPPKPELYKKL